MFFGSIGVFKEGIPDVLPCITFLLFFTGFKCYDKLMLWKVTYLNIIFSFQGICHLLTNIGTYCKESLSGYPPYELSHLDDSTNDPNASLEFENMEMENFYEKVSEDFEESKMGIGRIPFHGHTPKAFSELVDGIVTGLHIYLCQRSKFFEYAFIKDYISVTY